MCSEAPNLLPPTTGVRAAIGALRREATDGAFALLLVVSGLWLLATACAERFVTDLAAALQQSSAVPRPPSGRNPIYRVAERISRALAGTLRRCEPTVGDWHRRATSLDRSLLARRPVAGHW